MQKIVNKKYNLEIVLLFINLSLRILGARRAALSPGFLRSLARASLVIKPAFFKILR